MLTPNELDLMRRDWESGMSIKDIGNKFGLSGPQVSFYRKREGWTARPHGGLRAMTGALNDEQKARARELWEQGELTALKIAEVFGVTKNVIIGLSQRGNWGDRRAPTKPLLTNIQRLDRLNARFDEQMRDVEKRHPPALRYIKIKEQEAAD